LAKSDDKIREEYAKLERSAENNVRWARFVGDPRGVREALAVQRRLKARKTIDRAMAAAQRILEGK
jgi:hypothetical protein